MRLPFSLASFVRHPSSRDTRLSISTVAYIRSWRLALAMSATFPCLAIAGVLMNKFRMFSFLVWKQPLTILTKVTRWTKESLDSVAEGGALAEEVIASIRTAQAFGSQQALAKMYDKHIFKAHGAEMKTAITNGFGIGSFFFFVYAAYGLAFHYGTTLVLQGHADVGIVVNVFLSILIGSFSMTMIPPEYQAITNGCAAAEKLFATIDRVPTIDSESNEGRKLEGSIRGEISFKNVVFNYPSRPDVPVLKGLSINIKAGKTTALVGASGSGKSTIVNLIERFYDPLSGSVTLDNIDLRDLNVTWLRSQIGLVSQEPTLFATTIRGNVAHGLIGSRFEHEADEVKEKLIMEACTVANIDGFVTKLPDGYDTLVGERGFLLSGGQKRKTDLICELFNTLN
jgi:ATP-binding cassette, subfamily B (MDR/TAP), member 1